MDVRLAGPADRPAILALYERCAYRGGVADADEVVMATVAGEVVGVCRLCSEGTIVVLRGMQVDPDLRRRGIGNRLLDACAAALGSRTCYCLPYDHLIAFYGQVGFRPIDGAELPPFLQKRYSSYRDAGTSVVPMLRKPG